MKSPDTYLLPHAEIHWQTDDTPYAPGFDDVYWSTAGGLDEKQHVFLAGCDLTERWQALPADSRFSILETGFGFGLNFLLTLRAWLSEDRPDNCRLDYIAYEQYLVAPIDLKKMASRFSLEAELELLLKHYPEPVPGTHLIQVTSNVCLQLVVGEIHDQIETLDAALDAVYLDGFSPGRNGSMWDAALLGKITNCLRPGARVATYSVAGELRRSLAQDNLNVEKAPGFGRKRHMLVATQPGDWYPQNQRPMTVAVLGAGLTGLFCAEALRKRGHQVTLIDQNKQALGALQDIHQIAIYPQLSKTPQPYSNFYLRAYQYFLRHQTLEACGRIELLEGTEKVAYGEAIAAQLPGIVNLVDAATASELLGLTVNAPALHLPSAGWLSPQALLPDESHLVAEVIDLHQTESGWQVQLKDQPSILVDQVICCTGHENLTPLLPLKLMALRGQSITVAEPGTAPSKVFSGSKTWFPKSASGATVSGTYDRFDADRQPRDNDTQMLLDAIKPYRHSSERGLAPAIRAGVGIRSATRDRMPVVDQLPDWSALTRHFDKAPLDQGEFDAFQEGLYCAVGFGSHGGTLGPYCAEILARKLGGEPIADDLRQLSSVRFAFRDAGVKSPR